jgi:hypothetical protein
MVAFALSTWRPTRRGKLTKQIAKVVQSDFGNAEVRLNWFVDS